MGDRRLWAGGREPVRSAAQQALSDAAAAGEVVRRAVRARRAQARPAPVPGADGDQFAATIAAARPAFTAASATASAARSAAKSSSLYDGHPRGRGDRPLRGARRELRRSASTPTSAGARPACATSIATSASSSRRRAPWSCAPTAPRRRGCCSCRRRQLSARPRQLERAGRQVPDVQHRARGAHAVFEHQLNEYKSVQVTRIVHDFYDCDPKRGFYGGGGYRRAHRSAADHLGGRASATMPARYGAARSRRCLDDFPRTMHCAGAHHVAGAGDQQRRARSRAEGRVGRAGDARHLQGSSGRSRDRALPPGAVRGDHGGGRRAQA